MTLASAITRRTARLAILSAAAALALGLMAHAALAETLSLTVGAQRIIPLSAPVTRIVIANRGIVDASVLNDRQVQVVGLHPGHTAVTLFTAGAADGVSYTVDVLGNGGTGAAAAPGGLKQALARDPALSGITTRPDGHGGVVLSGSVPDLQSYEQAQSLAKDYGTKAHADALHVGGNQMVAVEIRFAAVEASTLQQLGFNFQALGNGIQGAVAAPGTVSSAAFSSLASAAGTGLDLTAGLPLASAFNLFMAGPKQNIGGVLSALSGAGLVQILAEPTLLVRSGDHASFLAGGEYPIPVPQSGVGGTGTITIQYHTYGVRLNIAPVVLSDQRIALRVSPEVSQIDPANTLTYQGFSVPAFLVRNASTTIELGDGQSYVIAGLMYNNDSYAQDKVPLLGDLPIIGNFFKVTNDSHTREELVVIATPHLVSPIDAKNLPPLPGSATANYNPGFGDILLNRKPLDQELGAYGLSR